MHNDTRRDIRVGDLDSLDPSFTATRGPGVSDTAHVGQTQTFPAVSAGKSGGGTDENKRPQTSRTAMSSRWVIPALVLTVLLLLGACGYLLYTQQQLATTLAALDARAQASVDSLASEVNTTSTTMQDTDDQVQRTLKVLTAQIKKLEQSLGALEKASDAGARQQAATDTGLKALNAELDRIGKTQLQTDAQQDARTKALSDTLDVQMAKQKNLSDALARLERNNDVAALRNDLNLLAADLREARSDYDRRLRAGEQATASNDAFRRQVNATLERINQQISELYQRR